MQMQPQRLLKLEFSWSKKFDCNEQLLYKAVQLSGQSQVKYRQKKNGLLKKYSKVQYSKVIMSQRRCLMKTLRHIPEKILR